MVGGGGVVVAAAAAATTHQQYISKIKTEKECSSHYTPPPAATTHQQPLLPRSYLRESKGPRRIVVYQISSQEKWAGGCLASGMAEHQGCSHTGLCPSVGGSAWPGHTVIDH